MHGAAINAGITISNSYILAMNRIALFAALIIGVLLAAVGARAQRPDKTTSRTDRIASTSKPSRSSHASSTKSSGKTSKGTSPSLATSPQVGDGGAAALEEAVGVEQVTGLEQSRLHADLEKDRRWFEDHIADDLTGVTFDGRLENKAQLIARCLDPANSAESERYEELSVRAVRPFGDVIVATGRLSQTGKGNNIQRRFTDVWVNRGGMWQQVATHVSAIEGGNVPSQSAAPGAGLPQGPNGEAAAASQWPAASQPPHSNRPTASASPAP